MRKGSRKGFVMIMTGKKIPKVGEIVKIIHDSRIGRVEEIYTSALKHPTNLYGIGSLVETETFIVKAHRFCYFNMLTKPTNKEKKEFIELEEKRKAIKLAENL